MFPPAHILLRIGLWSLLPLAAARADSSADLKSALARLEGASPIKAVVELQWSSRSGDEKAPDTAQATVEARAEDGPDGLRIAWSHDQIRRVAEEAKGTPNESGRPIRQAMDSLNATALTDYLNGAPELARRLQQATLIGETADTWHGRPAKLLTFSLTLPLSDKDRKYIKQLETSARVWIGDDGVPLAADSRVHIKGRAFLVIGFEQTEQESFEFASAGDRLVVRKHIKESAGSGGGESGRHKIVTTLTVG